jgi:hypothetical protein
MLIKNDLIKNRYSNELLKYLNLNDKLYTKDEIKNALIHKNPDNYNFKKLSIMLDNDGKKLFGCKCVKISLNHLISMINNTFLIIDNKPTCNYFEYNQIPVDV